MNFDDLKEDKNRRLGNNGSGTIAYYSYDGYAPKDSDEKLKAEIKRQITTHTQYEKVVVVIPLASLFEAPKNRRGNTIRKSAESAERLRTLGYILDTINALPKEGLKKVILDLGWLGRSVEQSLLEAVRENTLEAVIESWGNKFDAHIPTLFLDIQVAIDRYITSTSPICICLAVHGQAFTEPALSEPEAQQIRKARQRLSHKLQAVYLQEISALLQCREFTSGVTPIKLRPDLNSPTFSSLGEEGKAEIQTLLEERNSLSYDSPSEFEQKSHPSSSNSQSSSSYSSYSEFEQKNAHPPARQHPQTTPLPSQSSLQSSPQPPAICSSSQPISSSQPSSQPTSSVSASLLPAHPIEVINSMDAGPLRRAITACAGEKWCRLTLNPQSKTLSFHRVLPGTSIPPQGKMIYSNIATLGSEILNVLNGMGGAVYLRQLDSKILVAPAPSAQPVSHSSGSYYLHSTSSSSSRTSSRPLHQPADSSAPEQVIRYLAEFKELLTKITRQIHEVHQRLYRLEHRIVHRDPLPSSNMPNNSHGPASRQFDRSTGTSPLHRRGDTQPRLSSLSLLSQPQSSSPPSESSSKRRKPNEEDSTLAP